MSKPLPEGYIVRSRKEWEEILASADTARRGLVNIALRACGLTAGSYLKLTEVEKVEFLMKQQAEAAGDVPEKVEVVSKTKAGEVAKPAALAVVAKLPDATEKPRVMVASPAQPAAVSDSSAELQALRKQLQDLQAQVVDIAKVVVGVSKAVAETLVLVKDTQYMTRINVVTDPSLSASAEDAGAREAYYGKPLEGNG